MKRRHSIAAGFAVLVGLAVWVLSRPRVPSSQPADAIQDPVSVPAASARAGAPEGGASEELLAARSRIARLEARVRELESQLEVLQPRTSKVPQPSAGRRSWGPEQMIGAPDTERAGDFPTAWASLDPDGGPEWVVVDFPKEVEVGQVRVRETLGPGTIFMVSAILADGSEKILWHGTEPAAEAPVEMEFNPSSQVRSRRIRVQLDTSKVSGWNEIDAVELVGTDGTRQWASGAWASSTYADRGVQNLGIRKLGRPEPAITTEANQKASEVDAEQELVRQIHVLESRKKLDALDGAGRRPSGE